MRRRKKALKLYLAKSLLRFEEKRRRKKKKKKKKKKRKKKKKKRKEKEEEFSSNEFRDVCEPSHELRRSERERLTFRHTDTHFIALIFDGMHEFE